MWVLGIQHHVESPVDVDGLFDYELEPLRRVLITQYSDTVTATLDTLPVYRFGSGVSSSPSGAGA